MPDIFGIASIAAKVMLYVGVLTGTGTVLCAVIFAGQVQSVLGVIRRYAIGFGLLGLVAAVLGVSLRGAALTGDASGMVDPEMLGILFETQVGTVFYLRAVGLVVLILGALIGGQGLWLALWGGIVAIWGFTEVGHVPGLEAFWLQALLFVHLCAVAFWIGVFGPLRRLALKPECLAKAAELGHRFGRIASFAVPLLVIAGGVLSWHLVGSFQALFGTAYGIALLLKTGLVATLLGLAAANKLRFVPGLQAGRAEAGAALARSIQFESICVFGIFVATATMTSVLAVPGL